MSVATSTAIGLAVAAGTAGAGIAGAKLSSDANNNASKLQAQTAANAENVLTTQHNQALDAYNQWLGAVKPPTTLAGLLGVSPGAAPAGAGALQPAVSPAMPSASGLPSMMGSMMGQPAPRGRLTGPSGAPSGIAGSGGSGVNMLDPQTGEIALINPASVQKYLALGARVVN